MHVCASCSDNTVVRALRRAVLLVAVSAMAGCGSSTSPSPAVSSTQSTSPTVGQGGTTTSPTTSVTMAGEFPLVGQSAQFTLLAHFPDGTSQDVTSQAAWQTSNAAVATVSAAGSVAVVGLGYVDIQATYKGLQADIAAFLAQ
jgi:hypothetical protein